MHAILIGHFKEINIRLELLTNLSNANGWIAMLKGG